MWRTRRARKQAGPSSSQVPACCALLGESRLQPGGRASPVQNQHIAAAQPVELVKEHLALALGVDGHVQHQILARQARADKSNRTPYICRL